jgi:hypothetical protein
MKTVAAALNKICIFNPSIPKKLFFSSLFILDISLFVLLFSLTLTALSSPLILPLCPLAIPDEFVLSLFVLLEGEGVFTLFGFLLHPPSKQYEPIC